MLYLKVYENKEIRDKNKQLIMGQGSEYKKNIFALTPKMYEQHCVVCQTMLKNVQN